MVGLSRLFALPFPSQRVHLSRSPAITAVCQGICYKLWLFSEMLQNCSTAFSKVHSPPLSAGQTPSLPDLQLSSVNLLSVSSGKAQNMENNYLIFLKHLKKGKYYLEIMYRKSGTNLLCSTRKSAS